MSNPSYRVVSFAADFDLGSFDCGEAGHHDWLTRHASASVRAGVCAVYLLIERSHDRERVVGYFAITPLRSCANKRPYRYRVVGPSACPHGQSTAKGKGAQRTTPVEIHESQEIELATTLTRGVQRGGHGPWRLPKAARIPTRSPPSGPPTAARPAPGSPGSPDAPRTQD